MRSLQKLYGDEPGIARQSVVILRVEPKGSDQRSIPGTSERLDRTYRGVDSENAGDSRVRFASMANGTPTVPTSSAGAPITPSGEQTRVPLLMVYPNYFATIGMTISSGRDFETRLSRIAPAVCIVNESFVRQVFAGQDPSGSRATRVVVGGCSTVADAVAAAGSHSRSSAWSRIPSNPRGEIQPIIYMTFLQTNTGRGQMVLHARVGENAGEVLQRIRESVAAVDPSMPMFDVHTRGRDGRGSRATAPGRPARLLRRACTAARLRRTARTALICAGAADERAGHSDGARGPAP